MADLVDGLAEEEVADQPVAVRADHQEVDGLALELLDQLGGAVGAVEQDRSGPIALLFEDLDDLVEVSLIGAGLLIGRLRAVDPGHRRVDDVEQGQAGLSRLGQAQGPAEDLGVAGSSLEAIPILETCRGRRASAQSTSTLGAGFQAGEGRTNGLIVTQASSPSAERAMP